LFPRKVFLLRTGRLDLSFADQKHFNRISFTHTPTTITLPKQKSAHQATFDGALRARWKTNINSAQEKVYYRLLSEDVK
jgi:hypothetical protein